MAKISEIVKHFFNENTRKKVTANEIAEWIIETYPNIIGESDREKGHKSLVRKYSISARGAIKNINKEGNERVQVLTDESNNNTYICNKKFEQQANSSSKITAPKSKGLEKHLYPALWEFLKDELNVFSKRIREGTTSGTEEKGTNKWLHPDMVGLEDLSVGWGKDIKELVYLVDNAAKGKLWSFEVKAEITRANVRECYFQAVSNSSWAHYGYLVAPPIPKKQDEAMKELLMLSALHGIGFIELDKENTKNSRIGIPARERADVDWASANRLSRNKDFQEYLELVYAFYNNPHKIKEKDWPKPKE